MELYDFELVGWKVLEPQVDSDSDDLRNSADLEDWLYAVGDGAEAYLRYGALDEDLEVVEPETIYYSAATGDPFDVDASESIGETDQNWNSVSPIGYFKDFLGETRLAFRFGYSVSVAVKAENLEVAKKMVRDSVQSSFYFSVMDENEEIEYFEVTSAIDNELVLGGPLLPEGCSSCQYRARSGTKTCENCGGTTFERFF